MGLVAELGEKHGGEDGGELEHREGPLASRLDLSEKLDSTYIKTPCQITGMEYIKKTGGWALAFLLWLWTVVPKVMDWVSQAPIVTSSEAATSFSVSGLRLEGAGASVWLRFSVALGLKTRKTRPAVTVTNKIGTSKPTRLINPTMKTDHMVRSSLGAVNLTKAGRS